MTLCDLYLSGFEASRYKSTLPLYFIDRQLQYNLLNSSNKRACSNRFVNVTIVSIVSNNSGQKLKEKVKRDKRKLPLFLCRALRACKTRVVVLCV